MLFNNKIYTNFVKMNTIFISSLFYFFLIAPIFNPYIFGKTIYFYVFLPFFDIRFINFIFRLKFKYNKVIGIMLIFVLLVLNFQLFIRAFIILIIFLYLVFTYIDNKFYLYKFFCLSFLLAILQFTFLFISPDISYFLGPTNLSHMILGKYAGPTFTNFYTIFLLPRVSGLSREGGFFASLVIVIILIYLLDYKYKKKFYFKFVLLISFLISISKASLGIISVFFFKFRKIKFKIPFRVTFFFFIYLFLMIYLISPFVVKWALDFNGETFLHRFGGYYLMQFVSIKEFLFGHVDINHYYNLVFVRDIWFFVKNNNWTGWSFLLVNIGLLPTILIVFGLEILGFTLLDILLLTILSFNTNPLAITNQVVLIYFLIFLLHIYKKDKLNVNSQF